VQVYNNIHKYNLKITPSPAQISTIYYGTYSSHVGPLIFFSTKNELCGLHILKLSIHEHLNIVKKKFKNIKFVKSSTIVQQWANNIFSQKVPTNILLLGTSFQLSVWKSLLEIPVGKTVTYKDVAASIGKPSSFRATANAIGQNPICYLIPCHRVISSNGTIGGFRWGIEYKEKILQTESLFMQNNPLKY